MSIFGEKPIQLEGNSLLFWSKLVTEKIKIYSKVKSTENNINKRILIIILIDWQKKKLRNMIIIIMIIIKWYKG